MKAKFTAHTVLVLACLVIPCNAQNSIGLSNPILRACGIVEIGGGFTAPGLQHVPPVWNWGDGTTTTSFFPAVHRYQNNGQYTIVVSIVQGANILTSTSTSVTINSASSEGCGNLFVVHPAEVVLRDGKVRENLVAVHIDGTGKRRAISQDQLRFRSRSPTIASVSPDGVVTGTGFGDTVIEVEDLSSGNVAQVAVRAGDLRLEPPYLRLVLGHSAEQSLQVIATNADGSAVAMAGRQLRFAFAIPPATNPVAELTPDGRVKGLRVPNSFGENPYIVAELDGVGSANVTFVRVAEMLPELAFTDLRFGRVRYRIAERLGAFNNLDILNRSQVPRITDLALSWVEAATGLVVSRRGERTLINDVGGSANPNDPSVPCGLSGNPTLLGSAPGKEFHNSCLIIAAPPPNAVLPQWFIFLHEIGHDYTLTSIRFSQIAEKLNGSPLRFAYIEAFASTLAIYAAEAIRQGARNYELPPKVIEELSLNQLELDSPRWTNALNNYERSGADFTKMDPDVLTAIIASLLKEEGLDWYPRFHSIFLPQTSAVSYLQISNHREASSYLIAGLTAAIGKDMQARFVNRWGFPFDSASYERYLPVLNQLVRQRQSATSSDRVTSAASYRTGPIAPGSWVSLFGENLAPRFVLPKSESKSIELTSISITDSDGTSSDATLQFVSPSHINFLVPEGLSSGPAQLNVRTWLGKAETQIVVQSVSPGLFSANASGQGLAAATWLRVLPDGSRAEGIVSTSPLDLSPESGLLYLSFFGTGFRNQSTVSVSIGGVPVPVLGAVAQGQFAGLDQLVVGPIPLSLRNRGEVPVVAVFNGLSANTVNVTF